METCNPAPYGQACAGCSRAKCKCFYRAEGSGCERCHRLGKTCEPAVAIRKRKVRDHERQPPAPQPAPASRLEEKLDDLVSLLRSQAVEKQAQHQNATRSVTTEDNTPSTLSTLVDTAGSLSLTPVRYPEVEIDTNQNAVLCVRPGDDPNDSQSGAGSALLTVFDDVSRHHIPELIAEEQLETFRRAFITEFPFVHIPPTMSAAELRQRRPFLWLVIMSLTTKIVSEQFAMEETIWKIISQRIVTQHMANMDLLLGVICFGSWSHYFKQDKPFMTTVAQLAVTIALELDLQKDITTTVVRRRKAGWLVPHPPKQRVRTIEERRTFLAVYHLTSATWTAYRKTEPMRWTSYMDDCVRILSAGQETQLDILLATQVKCNVITTQVTCSSEEDSAEGENSKAPSTALYTAMLSQLNAIRKSLPEQFLSETITQFYLSSTELIIKEYYLSRPKVRHLTGSSSFQRIQDLESVLVCVKRWLDLWFEMPTVDWPGITMDTFSQFTHCVVALFKLNTLSEEGWDLEEVKKRANVFTVLDEVCDRMDEIPRLLGIVDAEGPRSGLFFKTTVLIRAIKTLFMGEAAQQDIQLDIVPLPDDGVAAAMGDMTSLDDLYLNLADEPWITDMFTPWDFTPGGQNNFAASGQFETWL